MAHSLLPTSPTSLLPLSGRTQRAKNEVIVSRNAWSCQQNNSVVQCDKPHSHFFHRRVFINGLAGAAVGLSVTIQNAEAAARRPPPPPPEKKDPNITGVRAKVLASMKRKEAMKEEIAKLREKGKQK